MKKLFYLLPLLALFVACRQEDPVGESARIVFSNQIEELTRGDNTLTTANLANFDVWAHNDNGVVFDGTRVEKQGDVWVSAIEKMWEEKQGYYFHAFAPSGAVENVGEYPNAERARGLGNFAYTNVGDKDLIYAYATRVQGSLLKINAEPVQLEFEHLLSRVGFTFKNNLSEGNITISNVQITEAAKSAELNCGDVDMANWVWNATSTGSYSFGGTTAIAKGASASATDVQFLFPAATRNYDISFSIAYESDAAEERTATISDVNLVMGKSYNVNLVVNDKDVVTEEYKIEFFVTEVKDWGENIELDATLNEPGHGFENGYEWVDLGLSVYWATCNIGANSPEESGDYFAWGEVEPKEYYDWSTYKYRKDGKYTKYCHHENRGYNGFVDNKELLDPEDDAATVIWGGKWRMPTQKETYSPKEYNELNELIDNCTMEYVTINGVNGVKFTSKIEGYTNRSIFLPAAGYRAKDTSFGDDGITDSYNLYGAYWFKNDLINYQSGWGFAFKQYTGTLMLDRALGFTIRPVCPK